MWCNRINARRGSLQKSKGTIRLMIAPAAAQAAGYKIDLDEK
jgi:hypothetical protein